MAAAVKLNFYFNCFIYDYIYNQAVLLFMIKVQCEK